MALEVSQSQRLSRRNCKMALIAITELSLKKQLRKFSQMVKQTRSETATDRNFNVVKPLSLHVIYRILP